MLLLKPRMNMELSIPLKHTALTGILYVQNIQIILVVLGWLFFLNNTVLKENYKK